MTRSASNASPTRQLIATTSRAAQSWIGRTEIGRPDLLHFARIHFKRRYVGNAYGADSFDFIVAHVGMSPGAIFRFSTCRGVAFPFRAV